VLSDASAMLALDKVQKEQLDGLKTQHAELTANLLARVGEGGGAAEGP
jgi:hypothetical protein